MDHETRIAELEAELAKAREQLKRLRGLESENEALRARVDDLHTELVTLSPPKLPKVSGAPRASGPATPSAAARARKSRLMTWTTLILVLAGAALAALPYLMNYLSQEYGDEVHFTRERGIHRAE